jgi:hypothetical protein
MRVEIKSGNKQNIEVVLDKLKEITKLDENQEVSYSTLAFFQIEWLLLSLVKINYPLSIENKSNILRQSLSQLAINNNYTEDFLLKQIEINLEKHFRKKEITYILLSALSITKLPFRKLRIGQSEIRIHGKQFPKEFREQRRKIQVKRQFKNEDENFTKVSVKIKSKDYKDAFEKAIESLEVFRALLCLTQNSNIEIRLGERSSRPINKIALSEILTLHYENGSAPDANYFYFVPDYKDPKIFELNVEKRENLKHNIKWLVKSFNKCKPKHQLTIQKALKLFVSAYDESDKFTCFLKGWAVLEILLNTDQNDTIIKRCNSLYITKLKPFNRQVLESLKQYRNELVHKGANSVDPIIGCFFVQESIYNLIVRFHLRHAGSFETIEEANSFLDNNTVDLNELKTRKMIIEKVIKIKSKSTGDK